MDVRVENGGSHIIWLLTKRYYKSKYFSLEHGFTAWIETPERHISRHMQRL